MAELIHILLVDDQEENLLALESSLEHSEYQLVRANSGEAALRYLLDHECAVILMDISMPGMDGFETAQLIRNHPRYENIPIIFITAHYDSREEIFKGYELGALDYLVKPFDPYILRAKVQAFINLFKKNKALDQALERQEAFWSNQDKKLTILQQPSTIEEATLQELNVEYRVLMRRYVRSVRQREAPPSAEVARFAQTLVTLQFQAKDLIRLHVKVLKHFTQTLFQGSADEFSLDARLLLVELMGNLIDRYREAAILSSN